MIHSRQTVAQRRHLVRCSEPGSWHRAGVTRVEVIVILVVFGLGLAVYCAMSRRPYRCYERSERLVCASNLKGIGTTCKIYANENGGLWPTPAFDESLVGNIDYLVNVGGGGGYSRSPNRRQASTSGSGGAAQLSAGRAFWIFVRSGDITVKQFTCPQSRDVEDGNEQLESYYDFSNARNLSYGFHVPFGSEMTRAREGVDNRMVVTAEKGPYANQNVLTPPADLVPLRDSSPATRPESWRSFNSQNHSGEGQNVLFADGHIEFARVPTVGVDHDNIYTVALGNGEESLRVAGESPWMRGLPPFSPKDAVGNALMSTDSLIFP